MELVITTYLAVAPSTLADGLVAAADAAVASAADRIASSPGAITTEVVDGGVRIGTTLAELDGTIVRYSGTDHLSEVIVRVPWSLEDRDGRKLLAANRFAVELTTRAAA